MEKIKIRQGEMTKTGKFFFHFLSSVSLQWLTQSTCQNGSSFPKLYKNPRTKLLTVIMLVNHFIDSLKKNCSWTCFVPSLIFFILSWRFPFKIVAVNLKKSQTKLMTIVMLVNHFINELINFCPWTFFVKSLIFFILFWRFPFNIDLTFIVFILSLLMEIAKFSL